MNLPVFLIRFHIDVGAVGFGRVLSDLIQVVMNTTSCVVGMTIRFATLPVVRPITR